MRFLRAFIATVVVFIVVDLIWILAVVFSMYEREVGFLLREDPNMLAAGIFYLGYIAGVLHLASRPAIETASWKTAAINGAVIGALAYGTYTITNYTIFEGWTMTLVVTDLLWGAFITALCGVVGYVTGRPTM